MIILQNVRHHLYNKLFSVRQPTILNLLILNYGRWLEDILHILTPKVYSMNARLPGRDRCN